jgi:hypothetical protein
MAPGQNNGIVWIAVTLRLLAAGFFAIKRVAIVIGAYILHIHIQNLPGGSTKNRPPGIFLLPRHRALFVANELVYRLPTL